MLLWFIFLPGIIMVISTMTKDNCRILCYPFVIAGLVFGMMLLLEALIVLIYVMQITDNEKIRYLHVACFGTFAISYLLGQIYQNFCQRRDVIRDPRRKDLDDEKE